MQVHRLEEKERRVRKIISRRKGFSILLEDKKEEIYRKVSELLSNVDKEAENLKREQNYHALLRYKESVREFMDYVIENVYRIKERMGIPLKKKRKIYVIVECVNEALEALAQQILKEQVDCMQILARVDQIKGLLLDLYN
jgi:hypothetical protein